MRPPVQLLRTATREDRVSLAAGSSAGEREERRRRGAAAATRRGRCTAAQEAVGPAPRALAMALHPIGEIYSDQNHERGRGHAPHTVLSLNSTITSICVTTLLSGDAAFLGRISHNTHNSYKSGLGLLLACGVSGWTRTQYVLVGRTANNCTTCFALWSCTL